MTGLAKSNQYAVEIQYEGLGTGGDLGLDSSRIYVLGDFTFMKSVDVKARIAHSIASSARETGIGLDDCRISHERRIAVSMTN